MNKPHTVSRATKSHARAAKGFTLIELLVVIAIIAILAAILFPVFARARENARRSSCQSNLKQIALSIFQYTQDYDEKLNPVKQGYTPWPVYLQPYIKSTQILVCPSISGAHIKEVDYASYGMNINLNQNGPGGAIPVGISLASINNPAEIIMLADDNLERIPNQCDGYGINATFPNYGGYGTLWWDPQAIRGGTSTLNLNGYPKDVVGPDARHLGGANAAYADGHVKWVKYDNLYTPPAGLTPVTNWRQWYVAAP